MHKKTCRPMYHCEVCGKKFDDVLECAKHTETCIGKLKCKKCDKSFAHWKLLVEHNEDLHHIKL